LLIFLLVGSRNGAILRRSDLSGAPRFLWECLTNRSWFPSSATSNGACRFPTLRSPARFAERFMRRSQLEVLSSAEVTSIYSTPSNRFRLPLPPGFLWHSPTATRSLYWTRPLANRSPIFRQSFPVSNTAVAIRNISLSRPTRRPFFPPMPFLIPSPTVLLTAPPPLADRQRAGGKKPRGGFDAALADRFHQAQAMVVGVLHFTHEIEITGESSHGSPPAGRPSPCASSDSHTSTPPGGNDVPFQFHCSCGP
jgi:hypothetical protein